MRADRLTRVEVEALRLLARPDTDWTISNRATKAMRRLARRGFAEPYGTCYPSGKPIGYRLTEPADTILERFHA